VGPILPAREIVCDEIPSDRSSFSARLFTRISWRFDRRHTITADSQKANGNSVRKTACRKTDEFPVPATAALIGAFFGASPRAYGQRVVQTIGCLNFELETAAFCWRVGLHNVKGHRCDFLVVEIDFAHVSPRDQFEFISFHK
jgi:hypothetical protein